ncbi:hypothetical protein HN419_02885 [Candidatus Woesearchaeota archaeon]|nr:hypothetical protein [Candidatus Woesearchaeota archaeon]MBT3537057.1 hypothetical protein [Candidatus Woesearchaeota archaeon]MBT4697667.1 hypothetical protein [Candidatus Woesearchaeota archaeon]MBT4716977.1 hypothetical protein [Candidatus Woesearchaeota archaeon]MBT7106633.1 hypothetical protein [Candidatus Woesearchaeota archaeon]
MVVVKDAFERPDDATKAVEPQGLPTSQVMHFRSQGYSNNQIVQALQRDGFKVHEIYDALNQVDVKRGVQPIPLEKGDKMVDNPIPPANVPPPPPPGGQQQYPDQGYAYGTQYGGTAAFSDPYSQDVRTEEMAESIIDEKWQDLIANVKRIVDWKEKTEQRMIALEEKFTLMKGDFDKLHSALLEKVGEYNKTIETVGTDVKAMEKVFSKMLPGFVENVNELSDITKELRLARQKATLKKP